MSSSALRFAWASACEGELFLRFSGDGVRCTGAWLGGTRLGRRRAGHCSTHCSLPGLPAKDAKDANLSATPGVGGTVTPIAQQDAPVLTPQAPGLPTGLEAGANLILNREATWPRLKASRHQVFVETQVLDLMGPVLHVMQAACRLHVLSLEHVSGLL